jgi:hypothetical protein
MNFRLSLLTAVTGAALLAIAAAPPAFAKRAKDSGSYSVSCLTSDSALQSALGITDLTVAPVNVTVSPASLWPPNHKMRAESFSVNLTQPFNPDPAASPYDNGADISVWVVGLTDDQVADDDGGGHGCGKPTSRQGADWSPANLLLSDPTTYVSGSATLTDATVTQLSLVDQSSNPVNVGLRAERCARDGTRTYTVSVVCCDTTGVSPVCDDAALETTPPTEPSTPDDMNVEVQKSRRHHGNQ